MTQNRHNRTDRFKAHRRHLRRALLASLLLGTCGTAKAQLPTGADVVAGQAAIAQAGNALNVNASTSQSIVNWDSFNVGAGNVANFNLPDANSAILNRVTSANMPSTIAGAVNSNGHVYLVNPSGIVVSSSGMVNTNGFTASTFDIANDAFMAGGALAFAGNGSTAAIVNEGTIHTGSGGAHLIANEIANHGTITSVGGNITLSSGGRVTLDNGVTYSQPSFDTLASGISPTAGLIQNTGTIRATGAATSGGEVYLVNPNGRILHDGTIAAQSLANASGYEGSQPDALARDQQTTGGHVQLEADDITLSANSSIDASGTHGGGTVLVGGDWQGSGAMTQATTVTMENGAIIDASATESGDGGTIVLWSDVSKLDSVTRVFGTLLARAGQLLGDGGRIETSGHQIDTSGISVNAGAENGDGGLWLIDPFNYVINSTAAANIVSALNSGTSVTVQTTANNTGFGSTGNSSDPGDITVSSNIVTGAMSGDATLTLQAERHIVVNAGVGIDATQNGNTRALNVKLWADTDNSGDGINILSSPTIATNGGSFTTGNGNTATIGGVSTKVGGDIYINGNVAQTINTGGGAINIQGETIVANSSGGGVTFNSGGGNVVFGGLINSGNQYTYVDGPDGLANSWDWSRTNARNGTAGGAALGDSYLVTITSRLENAIAGIAAGYRGAWIGAYRETPTPNDWYWADGPEAGQHFFTQSGSGGGSALTGSYSNFGAGEPNGTGASGETRGQFFGTAGQWNDLGSGTTFAATQDSPYAVLGYVRETNLNPTPLTINAGSGNVTFNAGVGTSKALSMLNINAGGIHLNGGSVNTTGTQTYNAPVILGAHTNLSTIQSNIVFGSTVNSNTPASPWNLNATITPGNTYYWVDWTNYNPVTRIATGTITVGPDVIAVTYSNPQGILGAQTNGGTNYWAGQGGGGFAGPSPYVSAKVANGPTSSDIIQLQFAGSQSLTFSQSVENLAFSVVSLNGNGYGFNQDFEIQSFTGLNGASPGFWGTGGLSRTTNGSTFNLNGVSGEPHGTIRFGNAFSELTWNSLANENWNGFTVGVSGTSNTAGRVQFNGAVGGSAALGAININGAMQTSANIVNAGSLNVTGLANLSGNVTTSGNQTFGSAITLGTNVGLTSSGGGVRAISTIAGNHRLDVNVAGTSSIDGTISGTGLSLAKSGAGTLTLSGTNTYTGATSIDGGGLSIASDANLGTAPSSATPGHLTLDGGTLIVTGNATLSSNRGIALGANHGTIDVASGQTLNYSGILSGSGDLTKSNAGTLNLSGANTFTGDTSIVGGTLQTNNAAALGSLSRVTLGNTAGANLSLLSNLTIGSLSGGGTTGGNVALGNRTLTTGGDATSTNYAGVISGTGSLIKAGVGEFTLLGNHTYTGATTIGAGSLVLRNNAPTTASNSFQGPGTLTIESVGDSFTSPLNTFTFNMATGTPLGGLTIGKSTNTADVTIGSAQTINGNIQIHGGSIVVNAGLTSLGGGTVSLRSGGTVTDGGSGFISAENLLINATGTTTLDSNSHSIGTLASNGGAITLVEANGFSIGTIGTTSGITSTGNIDLATLVGDLTIGQNINTTSTSASAIRLNAGRSAAAGTATGGNLILSGSPAITVGSGGRATLMTGGIEASTGLTDLIGSGSGRFRYNSDESTTNYSLALGAGLHAIYRERPTVTLSTGDQAITYGDTPPSVTASLASVNGDTTSQIFNS